MYFLHLVPPFTTHYIITLKVHCFASPPSDWEVRTGAAGHPLYYDHQNKVVVLDRPGVPGGKKHTKHGL